MTMNAEQIAAKWGITKPRLQSMTIERLPAATKPQPLSHAQPVFKLTCADGVRYLVRFEWLWQVYFEDFSFWASSEPMGDMDEDEALLWANLMIHSTL